MRINETTNRIIKLLTLPYKQKDEEWITRGTITNKIEQRLKNSKLSYISSSISWVNNISYLIYKIKITESIVLYMYYVYNEDFLKPRYKFSGYNLEKYSLLVNPDNKVETNINKDYIILYVQKKLIDKIKEDFISELNDLLLKYENSELELITKIKEILI